MCEEDEVEKIMNIVENMKRLGLDNVSLEVFKEDREINEKWHHKVNIPNSEIDYKNGNGEGIWAHFLTIEDKEIYDRSECGKKYKAFLCNSSIYIPILNWGTVIECETRGNDRPVLHCDWFDEIIKNNGDPRGIKIFWNEEECVGLVEGHD